MFLSSTLDSYGIWLYDWHKLRPTDSKAYGTYGRFRYAQMHSIKYYFLISTLKSTVFFSRTEVLSTEHRALQSCHPQTTMFFELQDSRFSDFIRNELQLQISAM